MRVLRTSALTLLAGSLAFSGCDCTEGLGELAPQLIVTPKEVHISNIGVAQDTPIVITISNPSFVPLKDIHVELDAERSDPAFSLDDEWPVELVSTASGTATVIVRPAVVSTIKAVLIVTAEEGARPFPRVEVPITVDAVDLGLPDILVDPDDELEFDRIGQGDVVRAHLDVKNVGTRDLIIDEVFLEDVDGERLDEDQIEASPIKLASQFSGDPFAPQASTTVDLVFAPQDTARHEAIVVIASNDPDEPEVRVKVGGAGSVCPVAVATLLGDPDRIEPLDTVRVDGTESYSTEPDVTIPEIGGYQWTLEQRPIGSTAVLDTPDASRSHITTDIAGAYVARLVVTDSTGVRSCNDALVQIDVRPTEELHIELVWDHPTADLDLHMVREGGTRFNHDGDVYFSNRTPEYSLETPGWSQVAEENPVLDADDSRGYGPENGNIKNPATGSTWNVFVHYWKSNTDGDPFTTATLRIYVYGSLQAELTQAFSADETMWHAIELQWPDVDLGAATITPRNTIETFTRPF